MISIAQKSMATVYADGVAIVIMIGLLGLFKNYRSLRKELQITLYTGLCASIVVNAVFSILYYTMRYQNMGFPPQLGRLFPTLDRFSDTLVALLWVIYVDYMIHASRDRLRKILPVYLILPGIITVFLVINLFTGILFDVNEIMLITDKPGMYVIEVVEFIFRFIYPLYMEWHYIKNKGRLHFFSVMPMVIPSIAAIPVYLFTNYSARAMGYAIGALLLFISFGTRWRFDDAETGFYNRHYISHILSYARSDENDYKSALIFRAQRPSMDFFEILKTELPKDGDLIRMDHNTVILFSENGRDSAAVLLSSLVQEAADEYEETHPGERAMDVIVSIKKRKKNENAAEFVRRVSAA